MRSAGVLWVTVLALPALAVLFALGTWQMQRKAWKDGLQAQIDARAGAPARPLDEVLAESAKGSDIAYARVKLSGRFKHEAVQFYYAPSSQPGGLGWHAYTPMQLDDGRWVIVNRGVVPDRLRERQTWRNWQGPAQSGVVGLLRRPGEAGWFTPENRPDKNVWYWRDVDGMAAAALGQQRQRVLPYFVDAVPGSVEAGGFPQAGTTNTKLVNRHLEYALTWYGLALTLIGVWAAFVWSRVNGQPTRV
ncbi:MAG: hypothetical protein RLZ98_1355 [Pseudomonadota bacterium]|jgi:surfeit locus 1 family protein